MSTSLLAKRQQQFMAYLTDGDGGIAEHIIDQAKVPVNVRLNIYHNAYRVRLKETIETDHEMLGLYLGDDLFDEMVAGYIQSTPSNYTSLRHYADRLPAYLEGAAPFTQHPIIAEIATFERFLLTAFDAEEASLLTPEQLASSPLESWPGLTFRFHPSMQLFPAKWNSVESWQRLKAGKSPDAACITAANWLIWRNGERLTQFESIADEELCLINLALQGKNFSDLCESLLESHTDEQASQIAAQYLLKWAHAGLLISRSATRIA